jgi:hypothetical protein
VSDPELSRLLSCSGFERTGLGGAIVEELDTLGIGFLVSNFPHNKLIKMLINKQTKQPTQRPATALQCVLLFFASAVARQPPQKKLRTRHAHGTASTHPELVNWCNRHSTSCNGVILLLKIKMAQTTFKGRATQGFVTAIKKREGLSLSPGSLEP